jgi:DNA-binding NtrC family response regulator
MVLIVDDSQSVLDVSKTILAMNGFEIMTAADGQKAWQIVERCAGVIGLVLTDLTMPRMDGIELAERIHAYYPELPVVLMSGFTTREMGSPSTEPTLFLPKPFTTQTLLQAVREGLERRRRYSQRIYTLPTVQTSPGMP